METVQNSSLRQKATIEITYLRHPVTASSRHLHKGAILLTHSVRSEWRIQRRAEQRLQHREGFGKVAQYLGP